MSASRHVGHDQRPRAGRGLEQRARHASARAHRQHADVDAAPDLTHIGHMARPPRPVRGAPVRQHVGGDLLPALVIDRAAQLKPQRRSAFGQVLAGPHQDVDAVARHHLPDEGGDRRRVVRGRQRREPLRVDAGAAQHREAPAGVDAARAQQGEVIRILDQQARLRAPQHRCHQPQRAGVVEPRQVPIRSLVGRKARHLHHDVARGHELGGEPAQDHGLQPHQMHDVGVLRLQHAADRPCRRHLTHRVERRRTLVEVDDPHAELLDLGKPARRPGRNHHAERNLLEEADQRPVVGERQPVLRHQQQDLAAQLSERIGAWRTPLRRRPPLVAHGLAPAGPTSCRNLLPACGRVELLPVPPRIGLWTPMAPYRLQTSPTAPIITLSFHCH